MPDLITGDNLMGFDIIDQPDSQDDGTGPDFHLVIYTLEGEEQPARWTPTKTMVTADQLARALHLCGLSPETKAEASPENSHHPTGTPHTHRSNQRGKEFPRHTT